MAKLDMNDKGKTKAALPTNISPSKIELTATDVPGLLGRGKGKQIALYNDYPADS